VSKRTLAGLALVAAAVLGGVIGYAWHAPGHTGTWDNIRNWLTAAAVIIGVPVALRQLNLQRKQLASQQNVIEGEVERNKRRDALLDGQLRELEQRARVTERQQAEAITPELVPSSTGDPPIWMGIITNGSPRPIRDVVCRLKSADRDTEVTELAETVGLLSDWKLGGQVVQRIMDVGADDHNVPLIRAGFTYAFAFRSGLEDFPDARVTARFTDDAGLHWELSEDLHLEPLPDRDDW
jgi:hypothetical protein